MKQFKVKNLNGEVTHSGSFSTQEELDAFLAKVELTRGFGKPERWVKANQEDISEALETREVEGMFGPETEYKLATEYTVEQSDITAQVEQERVNREALAYLASTDWKILRHLREKQLEVSVSLTDVEYIALEQSRADAASRIIK